MSPEAVPLVLVVDDEENIRFLVESGLQLAGLSTIAAGDGRAALAAVAEHRPDLIVLDVMMPELDGFAVAGRLRDAGDRTPIIFLTARDSTDDRVAGLTSGADDYVVKPFAIAELVARVELRLDQRGAAVSDVVLRCADLQLDTDAHRVTRSAFARWNGTAPVAVSSGEGDGPPRRHRLDLGGCRAVNSSLHIMSITQSGRDPLAKAFIARKRAEGSPVAKHDGPTSAACPTS